MKVNHSDMIRIARKEAVLKIVGAMKAGQQVPARITDRQDRYFATIHVKGQSLRAEFTSGVPGSNHLTLQLIKKDGDAVLFKLIQATETGSLREKVSDYIFLPSHALKNLTPAHLATALDQASSLLELNIFLLNPEKKGKIRGEGITALLNRLIAAGTPQQSLLLFTSLLEAQLLSPGMLEYILGLISSREKKKGSHHPQKGSEDILNLLNEVESETDTKENKSMKSDLFRGVIEILSGRESSREGELPIPLDGEFIPLKVYQGEDAWFFSLELSSLGIIDIIARKKNSITLYADSSEKLDLIRKEIEQSNTTGKITRINFLLRQDTLDKLVAINTFYSFNSQLDIKV